MKNYKIHKPCIDAIPERFRDIPLGALVKYQGQTYVYVGAYYATCATSNAMAYLRDIDEDWTRMAPWSEITPVEQWQPEKGENVAVWDDDFDVIHIRQYSNPAKSTGKYQHVTNVGAYQHCARIPDDLPAKGMNLYVEWWEKNGEKYEFGHE
jgi:hypothetical protein